MTSGIAIFLPTLLCYVFEKYEAKRKQKDRMEGLFDINEMHRWNYNA